MLVTPADHWPNVDSGLGMKQAGGHRNVYAGRGLLVPCHAAACTRSWNVQTQWDLGLRFGEGKEPSPDE